MQAFLEQIMEASPGDVESIHTAFMEVRPWETEMEEWAGE
jgi:hypothetical protein